MKSLRTRCCFAPGVALPCSSFTLAAAVESSYICPSCGESIIVPIDLTAGSEQDYVEDCPVCCCPNLLHVSVLDDGLSEEAQTEPDIRIHAEPESD